MFRKKQRLEKGEIKYHGVYDTHHICFARRKWNRGYAKAIRQFRYCTIQLPRDTLHKFIHDNMNGVAVPDDRVARYAYQQLLDLDKRGVLHDDDSIEKRLTLLIALFEYVAEPTAEDFRKQLIIIQSYKDKPP